MNKENAKIKLKAAPSKAIERAIEDCAFAAEAAKTASEAARAAFTQATRALETLNNLIIAVANDGTFFEVTWEDESKETEDKAK